MAVVSSCREVFG